jgi:outer membrane immunogenic protein
MKSLLKSVAAGAFAAAVSGAAATAADLPYAKAAPMSPAVFDWSGFYLGGQGGGFYQRDTVTTPGGELLSPMSIHDGSFFAGGYTGYNWQRGNVVFGVEGDWSWVLGGRALSASQPTSTPGFFASGAASPKWIATVSGRLGFAMNNALLYVKGGAARMSVNYTGNVETASGTVLATQTIGTMRNGWLVGAGYEYGWGQNWLARVEYNYLDFGTNRLVYTLAGFNAADFKTTAHVVKLGLAYKFQ